MYLCSAYNLKGMIQDTVDYTKKIISTLQEYRNIDRRSGRWQVVEYYQMEN
jgi:hypothetical protein